MPDIPATSLVVLGAGHWVLGTDLAVIVTTDAGATWKRVDPAAAGTGTHPAVTVMELGLSPDGYLYSATHGRGIWRIRAATL